MTTSEGKFAYVEASHQWSTEGPSVENLKILKKIGAAMNVRRWPPVGYPRLSVRVS